MFIFVLNKQTKTNIMTTQQQNTIDRIVSRIERLNGKQTVSVYDIRKGHISLSIFNVLDKVDFIRTTTYCDIEINTKGNVVSGFASEYTPKTKVKYPYIK